MAQPLFKNINIIGLGLIGGSIAKACKKYRVGEKIYGYDSNEVVTKLAIHEGVTDGIYDFKQSNIDDLIIVCSPLFSYQEVFEKLHHNPHQATIIDIGSLKEFAVQVSAQHLLKKHSSNFVPCHPIAGSEKSGFTNSNSDLFLNKKAILINDDFVNQDRLKKAELFWQKIGSTAVFMSSLEHDKIFALVSHLPQFLSFIAKEDYQNGDYEILNRHFRLQNSNPKMWKEIFDLNQANIEYYLKLFVNNIDKLTNNNLVILSETKDLVQHQEILRFTQDDTINNLILRRLFLVSCFVNLPDIKDFQKHSGTGFKDFTAILEYQKILDTNPQILENHKDSIMAFLKEIKDKINHYEFS